VENATVTVNGGIIYGSVFGGGEDGHVLGDVSMTISDGTIGTWGTSYVEGNVFGAGRGFSGEALTAGVVCGNVNMNISGGTMLGSVYGGGRLGSVGTYLASPTITSGAPNPHYGAMIPDGYDEDNMETEHIAVVSGDTHGYVTINITGGTIGNDYEYQNVTADGAYASMNAAQTALATWQTANLVPQTTYETIDNHDGTYTNRLLHTRGGNVYAGGMGRREKLGSSTEVITAVDWHKLGNVKSTKLTITGGTIKSNVYGGGEFGAVVGNRTVDGAALSTEVNITGGTIGTEIKDGESKVMYTFGSVFGGGTGTVSDVNATTAVADADDLGAYVADSTKVTVKDAIVRGSVYG